MNMIIGLVSTMALTGVVLFTLYFGLHYVVGIYLKHTKEKRKI